MADIAKSKLLTDNTGILKEDACVVLVKTEWNAALADELEAGALRILDQYKANTRTIIVPGAIEIPFAINACWSRSSKKNRPDAFIALGAVVRGDTPHFDYVCRIIADGILRLNLQLPVPSIFGVLTVDNEEQAKERIGGKHGHKGEEAAMAALKMIAMNRSLRKKK